MTKLISPLSPRLVVALTLGVALVSLMTARSDVTGRLAALRQVEIERANREAVRLQPSLTPLMSSNNASGVREALEQTISQSGFVGAVAIDAANEGAVATPNLPFELVDHAREAVRNAEGRPYTEQRSSGTLDVQLTTHLITRDGGVLGTLVLFRDAHPLTSAFWSLWLDALVGVVLQVLAISVLTVLLVRWSLAAPVARTAHWMRELRIGVADRTIPLAAGLFPPLEHEVVKLVSSLEVARASAKQEARLRDAGESHWTAERLRAHVHNKLGNPAVLVISNREPFMHQHVDGAIATLVPASGLVTALEPIVRACDGTWIAHGSGDADRETVDKADRIRVPPEDPEYTLRRVWLTPEEEAGYDYGFANEGLWPLCHIAHTRPLFRASDWAHYQQANARFADAALEEMRGVASPIVLVQDYHFALVSRLIKTQRPDARVSVFWHIPWPNPEAFGICPWQRELLDGLLGADLVGFHTQAHCNNFLETVDRALESQIDWEAFTVRRNGHVTHVRPFPISVECPESSAAAGESILPQQVRRAALAAELGITTTYLGVGVDRIDYTKGIVERFQAIECLLETRPEYIGAFAFVQIAAPSRSRIPRYKALEIAVESEAARINRRFETATWRPIVLRRRHHDHAEILKFYRGADLCLVTSLHDGMNLVAKEFVAARDDEDGVLILSRFAGAAGELRDALIVNPYDTDELALAIHRALAMPDGEREARMARMRRTVREFNIYRWAGTLMASLASIGPDA